MFVLDPLFVRDPLFVPDPLFLLPQTEEAKVKISEVSGDRVDNKAMLETIKQEESIIEAEKQEQRKEKEKKRAKEEEERKRREDKVSVRRVIREWWTCDQRGQGQWETCHQRLGDR